MSQAKADIKCKQSGSTACLLSIALNPVSEPHGVTIVFTFYSHKNDDNDATDDRASDHHSLWNVVKLLCQILCVQFLFNFHMAAMLYLFVVPFLGEKTELENGW